MTKKDDGCEYRAYADSKGRKHYPVMCSQQGLKCKRCGWNLEVEKRRIDAFKKGEMR